jgi:uncharacterized protein (DUF1015 family)
MAPPTGSRPPVRAAIHAARARATIEAQLPTIRPFRALRYDREAVEDLEAVVAPPYDVIRPAEHQVLLLRHPRNIVRLDLPTEEPGDEPGDRYRRAARTLAAWRSDGTFRKDPRPSIYVYEQTYRVPGTDVERTQRGFFGRLRLEPYGPDSGVWPHERTLAGPREDRYMLLRATGVNTSPVVGLYDDPSARSGELLAGLVREATPVADVRDDDGTRHRLWVVPVDRASGDGADAGAGASPAAELLATASAGPVTIADGHHRYETALRYRDERRMTRSCEEDPAFDYLMMLFLASSEALTVLPTHRVLRGLGDLTGVSFVERLRPSFGVTLGEDRDALVAAFDRAALAPGGRGRFGALWRGGGAILDARPDAFDGLFGAGHEALGSLDVARLGAALERAFGIDARAVSSGRVAYTKSASEARDWVDAATDGADLAILVEPTPVASIAAVAAAGDVMPQKSTYFHPKALSGLLVNPLEW